MSGTKLSSVVVGVAIVIAAAAPAQAITNGRPDGDGHSYAGLFVADFDPDHPGMEPGCSGVLIAPRVFLTAAHCVAPLPPIELFVSFDPQWPVGGMPNALIPVSERRSAPVLARVDLAHQPDLAALILSDRARVEPALLPSTDLLDRLAAKGGLVGQRFDTVGYGITGFTTGGGRPQPIAPLDGMVTRRAASSTFMALSPRWLYLTANPATGNGGACVGDSGGPRLLAGTGVVVATVSSGAGHCESQQRNYRLDTASARTFLAPSVPLP